MKKRKILGLLVCVPFFIGSCDISVDVNPPLASATLIYMVADNNLDYYAIMNIRQMERGLPVMFYTEFYNGGLR